MASSATIPHEMQAIVRHAAEPWAAGDSIKAGINRAAVRLRLSYRRARTLWYAQTSAVLAEEADRLRAWHRRYLAEKKARLLAEIEQLDLRWEQEWPQG